MTTASDDRERAVGKLTDVTAEAREVRLQLTLTLNKLNTTIDVLKGIVSVVTSPDVVIVTELVPVNEEASAIENEPTGAYATSESDPLQVHYATEAELAAIAQQRVSTDAELESVAQQRLITDDELVVTATELTATVAGLIDMVAGLQKVSIDAATKAKTAQKTATAAEGVAKSNNRRILGVTALILLDLIFTVLVFVFYNNMHTVQQQVLRAIHEQCSTDNLILASYSARSRALYPEGPVAYDTAFTKLRQSAERLGCAPLPVK